MLENASLLAVSGPLGLLAGILALFAYSYYAYSIFRGDTRPSRTTWIIWAVVLTLAASGYRTLEALDTTWLAYAYAAGSIAIALISLRYGTWTYGEGEEHQKWFDGIATVIAVVGIILWGMAPSIIVALLAFILADFAGALSTIIKTWERPAEEDWRPWLVTLIANILHVTTLVLYSLAVGWSFGVATLPVYLLLVNFTIFALIVRPYVSRSYHGVSIR
ncbi:MAG TPA: hypothetical protein VGA06_02425 [Candidatus Paceibacterota bacterium]|jgi:hypothetical protein